jgi:cysteine-rich CPCC protein
VRARHGGPLGEWIVYREGRADRAWAGRDVHDVVGELFELPHGTRAPWVHELIATLAGRATPLGVRYACPCCDFLTFTEAPSGSYDICPVCGWEDDPVQFRDPEFAGGANDPSLLQARAAYQELGAGARPPRPEERP